MVVQHNEVRGMKKQKLSISYRLLRKLGFNYSEEEYGQVSLWRVIKQFFGNIRRKRWENMMDWAILEPFNPRKLRPKLMRSSGAHIGKDVFIGAHVYFDMNRANLITIEDKVQIASGTSLLCHKKDLHTYCKGDDYTTLPYKTGEIHLKKGCAIGTNSLIMPGVTVGEGAIIGANSLVTTDIPAWSLAIGRPAKVVKTFPDRVE